MIVTLLAALVVGQAVDPNDRPAVVEFACAGGVVEAFDGLGKNDDTIRQTRAQLRCKGAVIRLTKDGTLAKESNPVEYGCGMGVGVVFHLYDLEDEIAPVLSARARTYVNTCVKNVHEMLKPKPKTKKP